MTRAPAEQIAELDGKIAELRELVREANGTLKDIRHERRETEAAIRQFRDQIDARLVETVEEGLARYNGTVHRAMQTATERVTDRFDMIAALCLGEDPDARVEGKPPLEEMIRRYVEYHGPFNGAPFTLDQESGDTDHSQSGLATYRRKRQVNENGRSESPAAQH